jgi:hypothetical protein
VAYLLRFSQTRFPRLVGDLVFPLNGVFAARCGRDGLGFLRPDGATFLILWSTRLISQPHSRSQPHSNPHAHSLRRSHSYPRFSARRVGRKLIVSIVVEFDRLLR